MAANVGSLLIEVGANVARLQRDMGKAHQIVANAAKQMDRTFKTLGVTVAGVFSVQAFQAAGAAIYQAGVKAQQLERAFKAISGAGAGQEMEFLRTTAAKLGLNFYELAEGYKGMAAAARGTAVEGQAVRDIFTATSEAATALGLSGEQTQGALLALSQMMSKGKISAEELRGQLGERLPGAFQVFAQALGVTTAKLDKMLEQGQVGLDVLPKVAAIWHQMYGSQASASAMNDAARATDRMAEAWMDFKAGLFQAEAAVDGIQTVTTAIKTLGGVINDVAGYAALPFYNIAAGIAVVKGEMDLGAWIGAGSPDELRRNLAQAGRATRDRSIMQSNRFGLLVGPGAGLDIEAEFNAAQKKGKGGGTGASADKVATAIENITAKLAAMNDTGTDGEGRIAALNKEYGNFAETLGKGHPLVKQYAGVLAYANEHYGNTPAEVAKATRATQEHIAELEAEINATKAATDAYGNINREQFNALKAAADAEREYKDAVLKGIDPVIAARERDLKVLKAQNEAQTQNLEVLRSFYAEVASSLNRPQYKVQAVDREMAVYSAAGADPGLLAQLRARKMREVSTDAYDGMRLAAEDYAASATNAAENVATAFNSSMNTVEDAMVRAFTKGSVSFSEMADSIIADLVRIQVRQNITGPIASALSGGSGGGGFFSWLGSFWHSGGVIGRDAPSFMRPVDPSVFVGAPRLHTGLASDEFPAILQKGETVIPKGGGAMQTQTVTVNIKDSEGKAIAAPQTFNVSGMRQTILDIVWDGIARNEGGRWRSA